MVSEHAVPGQTLLGHEADDTVVLADFPEFPGLAILDDDVAVVNKIQHEGDGLPPEISRDQVVLQVGQKHVVLFFKTFWSAHQGSQILFTFEQQKAIELIISSNLFTCQQIYSSRNY